MKQIKKLYNKKETNPIAIPEPTAVFAPDLIVAAHEGQPTLSIFRESDGAITNISTKNVVYDIDTHNDFLNENGDGYGYIADLYDQHTGKKHNAYSDVESQRPFLHYIPNLDPNWNESFPQKVVDFDGVDFTSTPNFNQIVCPQSALLDNIWTGGGVVEAEIFLRDTNIRSFIYAKEFVTNGNASVGYNIIIQDKKIRLLHTADVGNIQFKTINAVIEPNTRYKIAVEFNKSLAYGTLPVFKINDIAVAVEIVSQSGTLLPSDSACLYPTIGSSGINANNNAYIINPDKTCDGSISNVKITKAGVLSASYLPSTAAQPNLSGTTVIDYSGNGLDGTIEGAIEVNCNQAKIKIRNNNVLKLDINDDFFHNYSEITVLRTAQYVPDSSSLETTYNIKQSPFFFYDFGNDFYQLFGRSDSFVAESFAIVAVSNAIKKALGISTANYSWVAGEIMTTLVEQTTTSNIVTKNNINVVIDQFDNAVIGDDLTPSSIVKTGTCQTNTIINNLEVNGIPSADYLLSNIVIYNKVLTASQKAEIESYNAIKEGTL